MEKRMMLKHISYNKGIVTKIVSPLGSKVSLSHWLVKKMITTVVSPNHHQTKNLAL
jgi:hypothetical protein